MSQPGLLPPGAERREYPREAASDPVKIRLASGHVVDAVVVDRSLRGMRLRLDDVTALIGEITVMSAASGAAYFARVVWRTAPYAGLQISKAVEMRSATGPDTVELRKMWREHIVR